MIFLILLFVLASFLGETLLPLPCPVCVLRFHWEPCSLSSCFFSPRERLLFCCISAWWVGWRGMQAASCGPATQTRFESVRASLTLLLKILLRKSKSSGPQARPHIISTAHPASPHVPSLRLTLPSSPLPAIYPPRCFSLASTSEPLRRLFFRLGH